MKFEYEKPNLEELELVLEGSFLNAATKDPNNPDNPGVDIGSTPEGSSTEWG